MDCVGFFLAVFGEKNYLDQRSNIFCKKKKSGEFFEKSAHSGTFCDFLNQF
jgi:hypothetical protein